MAARFTPYTHCPLQRNPHTHTLTHPVVHRKRADGEPRRGEGGVRRDGVPVEDGDIAVVGIMRWWRLCWVGLDHSPIVVCVGMLAHTTIHHHS